MTHLMSLHPWYVLFIGMCLGAEIGIYLHHLLTHKLKLLVVKQCVEVVE